MLDRRGFLKTAAGSVLALVLLPVRRAFAKKLGIALDKAPALGTVGGSVTLKVQDREILFVRDGDASIRAFDPLCTHQACKVEYDAAKGRLVCPCHDSTFRLSDGKAMGGPAKKPLPVYECRLDGDRILLTVPD